MSFTTETTEKNGNNGMSQPSRAATRNPWPIIRFLAHSRFWASCRRSLSLGEKPKSATLRAKEYERNRLLNCSLNTEAQRHKGTEARRSAPAMERLVRFRSHSFNRGAADLVFFAFSNERHLSGNQREWRKRRIIGRILRMVCRTVRRSIPSSSVDFRVFRSKKKGWCAGCPSTHYRESPFKTWRKAKNSKRK